MNYKNTPLNERLAESLDEMLVDNGIEKPRQHFVETNSLITKLMGLKVTKRATPRVEISFDLLTDKPLESFFTVKYKNCSARFKITDCSIIKQNADTPEAIKSITNIQSFIKQMWRNNKDEFFALLDELYDTPHDKINKIIASQRGYE